MERLWPHSPAPLVAVGGGIAAAWFFGLQALGVSTVGLIPQGFPSLTMPDLALIEQLAPGALGIALMSFTETIAAGRAFARPGDPPIDANRELIATGAANLGGAFLGAMPAGGGTSQTAVVRAAGGRSQKASLVTAGTAVATMLLLAPLLGLLPNATLAAVVIVYSVGLIQPAEFLAIRKVRTMEFRWAIVAALGVLMLGTLKGIVVAIILSLIGLTSQTANPRVSVIGRKRGADVLRPLSPEHPDDETFEGLLIVRPEGRLYFVNVQNVAEQIDALVTQYKPRVLALDMSRVPDIEYSALQALMEGEARATERGAVVWLVGLESRRTGGRAKFRAGRTTRPRAHAVQRARGDRTLSGVAGNCGRHGLICTDLTARNHQLCGDDDGKEKRSKEGRAEAQGKKGDSDDRQGGLRGSLARRRPRARFPGRTMREQMKKLHVELVKLQEWVKLKGLKVCIVFEGRDGAGKGGTIKAITERVSPRVFRVVALTAPTEREKSQMYVQRYLPHLPAAGEVVIFDRSWYNRAGVERVMGFCTEEEARDS